MHFAHILQSNSKCWHWDNRKIPASYVDMQNQLMQCWIQTNMAILGASMNINAFMMIMMTSCNGKGFPISYHLGSHGLPDTKGQYHGALVFYLMLAQTLDEQTVELTVIWKAVALTWRHINTDFFSDYRTALSEMPDEISRNLASLHMSMWNWKNTHAGVHPPYYRYVALKLKRYHGAILFGGELSAPGVAIPTTPCHQGHQNAPQILVHISQIIMRPGNLKILNIYTQ